jgi:hypothetical protein
VLLGLNCGKRPEVITAKTPTMKPSARAQAPKLRSRSARSNASVARLCDVITRFHSFGTLPAAPDPKPTFLGQRERLRRPQTMDKGLEAVSNMRDGIVAILIDMDHARLAIPTAGSVVEAQHVVAG